MSSISFSQRARNTPASPIRRLSHLADSAQESGVEVLHLNIGQPDIDSPPEFFEGLQAFGSRVVAYEASEGNRDLRNEWSRYMNQTLSLDLSADDFLITVGASEALVFLFMSCCDPGDEVIIFDPTYANYIGFAAIAGVRLVPVLSLLDHNFALPDPSEIVARISDRTRAILLCNPNNPTGTTYTREELEFLIDLCNERNLFLVVDETYRELVYDDRKPLSVFHLAPRNERLVVVDSLSKRFSLCGARIGCIITINQNLRAHTLNIAQARLAAPTLGQVASAHMLRNISEKYLTGIRNEYELRRNTLFDGLSELEGIAATKPGGAFYTVARLPVADAEEFASFLLREYRHNGKTLFLAPAAGFYMQAGRGKNKVRIASVLEQPRLLDAVSILESGLREFNNR